MRVGQASGNREAGLTREEEELGVKVGVEEGVWVLDPWERRV